MRGFVEISRRKEIDDCEFDEVQNFIESVLCGDFFVEGVEVEGFFAFVQVDSDQVLHHEKTLRADLKRVLNVKCNFWETFVKS